MGHKHLKISDYKNIKGLLLTDLPKNKVAELVGSTYATINLINKSKNFADYRRQRYARNAQYRRPASGTAPIMKGVYGPGRKGKKDLTQKEYDTIKGLSTYNLGTNKIAEITKRSYGLVSGVINSEDFAGYKARRDAIIATRKAKLAAESQAAEATTYPLEVEPQTQPPTEPSTNPDMTLAIQANTQALVDLAKAWNSLEIKLDEVLETKRPWLSRIK